MMGRHYAAVIILLIIVLFGIYPAGKNTGREEALLQERFSAAELEFINANGIAYKDLEPYLKYHKFDIYKYFQYEEVRFKHGYTHLESLNHVHNPDYYRFYHQPREALFPDTPLMLVNKCHYLDKDYVPGDLVNVRDYDIDYIVREGEEICLRKAALDAYVEMYEAARADGIELMIFSGYRSYEKQASSITRYTTKTIPSAPVPAFRTPNRICLRHQPSGDGLTMLFAQSPSFAWLSANCHKYGFILRFPAGKEHITGYTFEPWHFRYVGDYAETIHAGGLTLENISFPIWKYEFTHL